MVRGKVGEGSQQLNPNRRTWRLGSLGRSGSRHRRPVRLDSPSMAKECFCGCGRKVKFTDRGLNAQGRHTLELVNNLSGARDHLAEGPLVEGGDNTGVIDEMLTPCIERGQMFVDLYSRAVHHEPLPGAREANRLRGEWTAWRKNSESWWNLFGLPDDELIAVIEASKASSFGEGARLYLDWARRQS